MARKRFWYFNNDEDVFNSKNTTVPSVGGRCCSFDVSARKGDFLAKFFINNTCHSDLSAALLPFRSRGLLFLIVDDGCRRMVDSKGLCLQGLQHL